MWFHISEENILPTSDSNFSTAVQIFIFGMLPSGKDSSQFF
jgi:hypothetical protein